MLHPDHDTWRQTIIDKWVDLIDPNAEVHLYVVTPPPFGGPGEVLAHVLVAQNQHRGFISSLITTLAPGDDLWDPPRVALKLPSVVDKGLLIQESGLFLFCPPFIPFNDCTATYGDQVVFQDALRPAHSGDSFLCVADSPVASSDIASHDFAPHDIDKLFDMLAKVITRLTASVLTHVAAQPSWTQMIEGLDHEMIGTQIEIESFVRTSSSWSHAFQPEEHCPAVTYVVPDQKSPESCFHTPTHALYGLQPSPSAYSLAPLVQLRQELQSVSDGHDSMMVMVWYSDHIRFPICTRGKRVTLQGPIDRWYRTLLRPWAHEIWPHDEVQLFLVRPPPPRNCDEIHAHVLVLQHPLPDLKTILIAVQPPDSQDSVASWKTVPVPVDSSGQVSTRILHDMVDSKDAKSSFRFVFHHGQTACQGEVIPVDHATCITALPIFEYKRWPYLSDADFAGVLQSSVIASSGADCSPSAGGGQCDYKKVFVPCPGSPVTLSLDAVVPKSRPSPIQEWQDQLSTLEWFQVANWKQAVIDSLEIVLNHVPPDLVVTDATLNAIYNAMESSFGPYELVELFVDGATSSAAAGWSVVVVVHHQQSTRLLGVLAGPVILGDAHDSWLGAQTVDNIAAELSALAAALAFCVQTQFDCPVHVRPDLSLSRLIAQELVTTVSNPLLAKLCRALSQWVPTTVSIHEIRGHSNNPWNDLADSLAKFVTGDTDRFQPVRFGLLHQFLRASHDVDWSWLQGMPSSMPHCFPNFIQQSIWQFPPSMRKVQGLPVKPVPPVEPVPFACKMATINVLALDKVDCQMEIGRRNGARTIRLDHQLHAERFHVAGLQETRTLQGQFRTNHFLIFSSGCVGPSAARFGCELWLHRTLPLLNMPDGPSITFSDCTCTVRHADPRRLVVKIEHDYLQMTAVVLHAPCLGKATGDASAPIDVIKDWWTETARIWQTSVDTEMVCVFADANATLATGTTEFFQDHHSDATTAQSHVFEEFLVEHELFAPSTFAAHHVGPSFTWTHSNGRRLRLDFIMLTRRFFDMVSASSTWTSYDSTFSHEDHVPACVELSSWMSCAHISDDFKWDDLALLCPDRCAAFQEALATLPVPAWEISVDSHCAIYEKQIMQLAQQFFARKPGRRRRPTLSAETLDAIAFKRHVLDCGRAWAIMTDPVFKAELKGLETHVRKLVCRDLQVFYDQILVQLQEAGHLSDHKRMFRMIARLGGRKHKSKLHAKPLPMLRTANGSLVNSFAHQQSLWLEQFSKIEAGLHISWQALQRSDPPGLGLPRDMQEACLFPTDWNLQSEIAKLARGKVPGPNGLTPCILKAGGSVFTKQFAALTVKTVAHGKEPTSWKGGRLAPLYKGKDSPCDPAAYRAIYISDFTSKLYHKMLRQHCERSWSTHMDLLQLGGRKAMGTDLAHHMLEAHQFWCRRSKVSSAVVFFDLRAAFYSVLRQAPTATELDPTALITALTRMGTPPEVIEAWLHQASSDHAIQGASPHMEKLIHDCMAHTHILHDRRRPWCLPYYQGH